MPRSEDTPPYRCRECDEDVNWLCPNCSDCEYCHTCRYCEAHDDWVSRGNLCGDCDACVDCCECSADDEEERSSEGGNSPIFLQHRGDPTFHKSKTYKLNPSRRYISVEIEVSGIQRGAQELYDTMARWGGGIVHDGSLPSGGFEINTPPCNGDKWEQHIREVCDVLQRGGAHTGNETGLHTHVDVTSWRTPVDRLAIGKLITLYAGLEDALFSLVPAQRRRSHYSTPCGRDLLQRWQAGLVKPAPRRILKGKPYKSDMKMLKKAADLAVYSDATSGFGPRDSVQLAAHLRERKARKYDSLRYRALNLHSLFFRGTVELRLRHGTARAEEIIPWGMMLADLHDYVESTSLQRLEGERKALTTMSKAIDYLTRIVRMPVTRDMIRSQHDQYNR